MENLSSEKIEAAVEAMFREASSAPAAPAAHFSANTALRPSAAAQPRPAAVTQPRPAQAPPRPAQARPAPAKAKTVLVVDDNKDYRDLVKHLLSVHHYKVMEACDGLDALEVLKHGLPDMMLVDFNMPKMNGYELIQEVRSNYETRKLIIVMFTGATNRAHLRSLNMDISEFLEKPVPNARLLETINRLLGKDAQVPAPKPKPQPAPKQEYQPESNPGGFSIERFEIPDVSAAPAPAPTPSTVPISVPQPVPQMRPAPVEIPVAPAPVPVPEPEPEPQHEEVVEDVPEMESLMLQNNSDLELLESGTSKKEEQQDMTGLENLAKDSPLIQRVNNILVAASDMKASDIHIEPGENNVLVRVRVDGVLKSLTTLPISIHPRLTARIKIMASLIITERRLPQDGQFRVQIRGNKIEFRVSTLPCTKGEKIVMRILGQSKLNSNLSQLDLRPRELASVQAALKSPNGLILVTGPTGSGKTTTLYTMINVLNKPDVNIMTAEDPVEYEVPNVNQVKILPAVGLTFESTLRAFLRQDPDIMLVGEIRDLETAEISIKASITGHLVFSTLHTNSAPATIVRLTHMGVAPYLVAASVKMVIAQRLVRKLCNHCKVAGPLNEEDKHFLTEEELGKLGQVYHPAGCSHCHNTGYSGRKPVFEVMPIVSSAMRQLITSNHNVDMLNELAVSEGMTSLRQAALSSVQQGNTSMQEAMKIMMG